MNVNSTLLYVEDDENDRVLVDVAWRRTQAQAQVKSVADGQTALAWLQGEGTYANRKLYPFPVVLLLDLKLPRMSGFEVLERIRQRHDWDQLPVLIFSASDQEKDIKLAMEQGANGAYKKPVDLATLVAVLKEIQLLWLTPDLKG